MNTGPRNRLLEELFHAAADLPTRERSAYLAQHCPDSAMREHIGRMLAADDRSTGDFSHDLVRDPRPGAPCAVTEDAPPDSASLAPVRSRLPAVDSYIGKYQIIRELGRGGMGAIVYLARDIQLGRLVALKFLGEQSSQLSQRFFSEAQVTATFRHENIVVIYDVGEHDGHPYMVLEYLEGRTLRQELRDHAMRTQSATYGAGVALPASRVIEIMIPVVRALCAAHAADIVHRDLKPENILLTTSGAVKVLDFGIAKALSEHMYSLCEQVPELESTTGSRPMLTGPDALMGTLPYMSPEQLRCESIDHRTDLWAAGIMLHELATGRHPLEPISLSRLMSMSTSCDPMPSAHQSGITILPRLATIIDRCLRKDRAERIESAAALLSALQALSPARHSLALSSDQGPFAGLAAFQDSDADRFFGRSREIASVVARLRVQPLVTVVGPSGAGKSSLVRAGVIPALERTQEGWYAIVIRPGRAPMARLAGILARSKQSSSEPASSPLPGQPDDPLTSSRDEKDSEERRALIARCQRAPGYLAAVLRAWANHKRMRVVLFVDQFEELYTLGASEAERAAFVACLESMADDEASPLRVILSMRSDFLDRLAQQGRFIAEVTQGLVFLPPVDRNGMYEALTRPVEAAGYTFEAPALVDRILDAVDGSLPLLQFTAVRLWEARNRKQRVLSQRSYDRIGGIAGTLASHADAVLAAMPQSARLLARTILERLVTPERMRAVASLQELRELPGDPDAIERVVHDLVGARLLAVESGADNESNGIELIHESLIDCWPTLQRWLDENQEDAAFLARLRTSAREWQANGCRPGMLWRDEAVHDARRWRERYRGELPSREQRYLDAAVTLANQTARRKRLLVCGTIVLLLWLVIATTIALLRIRQSARTLDQQNKELIAKERARVAAEATARLASSDAEMSREELRKTLDKERRAKEAAEKAARSALQASDAARVAERQARTEKEKAVAASNAEREARKKLVEALEKERTRIENIETETGGTINPALR